ncbi:MAG: cell division protein FtsQ/DivIB [Candidatus Omnitrophica bacterium]|jgi:hypothetical protein|nr:cell division protein FtsQ/DivIB [Candidatus Omnitrophota bacterium]
MRRKRRKLKFKFRLPPVIVKVGLGFIVIGIVVFILGYTLYRSELFKIKTEGIKSNLPLSKNLVDATMKGKSLFTVDIKSISRHLEKEYPEYKAIYVLRSFPSSLFIKGEKRIFFAQVKAKSYYPVDKEAVLLTDGSEEAYEDLIVIELDTYSQLFRKGFKIKDNNLTYAFKLIEALKAENFMNNYLVKSINPANPLALYFIISDKGSENNLNLSDNDVKIIIGDSNFQDKIKNLKGIINKELKNTFHLVKYIDLRFKKVYIEFKR